jgi:hypothetical protein
MQFKNPWENAKLIMLLNNYKLPPSTTVADFFIPSQIKQKLFLLEVTCVGDCYCYCYRHGIFQSIL